MYYLGIADVRRAEANGISKETLRQRYYILKWDKERAITQPKKTRTNRFSEERKRAVENGISKNVFNVRIAHGWNPEEACTVPTMTKEEACKKARKKRSKYTEYRERGYKIGINDRTFDGRIYRGWSLEEACTIPPFGKGGRRKGLENKKENTCFNTFKGA